MDATTTLRTLLAYSDATNRTVFNAAASLTSDQLDQPFDMGMGTLRKTLAHLYVGEMMWLRRWRGEVEAKWPPYESTQTPGELLALFEQLWPERDAFVATLSPAKLEGKQSYRDSKGSVFSATLHDMLVQGIVHSTHHRAQAVNMIRRLGGQTVEVDFMYWRRVPS